MIDTNYRRDVKLFGIQSSCPTRTVPHRKCQAASVRFPAAIVQIMVQKMVQKSENGGCSGCRKGRRRTTFDEELRIHVTGTCIHPV